MTAPPGYQMVTNMSPKDHPTIPAGSKLGLTSETSLFPVLTCCQYSYWAYSFVDNRDALDIVLYDPFGGFVKRWERPGARYLSAIVTDNSARSVSFVGQGGREVTMSWADLGLMEYRAGPSDLMELARFYHLPLTTSEAQQLAARLPPFSCATCSTDSPDIGNPEAAKRDLATWQVGAVLGGLVGGAIGALIGGPPAAALGASVGAQYGAGIGQTATAPGVPGAKSTPAWGDMEYGETFAFMDNYPIGPFGNTGLRENLFDWEFPRFRELPDAGAVAKPDGANKLRVWYPMQSKFGAGIPVYPPHEHSEGDIHKFIFVIVRIPAVTFHGRPAYQMRLYSDSFYPDTIPATERINHSQLSEGGRFAALLGYQSMEVFGAGTLYVQNGVIIGMDSRTGHYYWSFYGKDDQMLQASFQFLDQLGYDSSHFVADEALSRYLQDWL